MDDPLVRAAPQTDRVVQRLNEWSVDKHVDLGQKLGHTRVRWVLEQALIPIPGETNEIEILFLTCQTCQRSQPGSLLHRLSAGEGESANRLEIELFDNFKGGEIQSRNKWDPSGCKAPRAVERTALYPNGGARTRSQCLCTHRNSRNVQDMGIFRLLVVRQGAHHE